MNAMEIKPPNAPEILLGYTYIFLGGSIEMGTAEEWQSRLIKELSDEKFYFLNPRRDNWDSSWEQSIRNKMFKEQVVWELKNLEESDMAVIYFDPSTQSPITLFELGLLINMKKTIVYCPNGFWRKGNIEIICERYDVVLVETFEDLKEEIKKLAKSINEAQ